MDASQYPVTTPWGYSADYPLNGGRHKGEDRAMPVGTPVVVNGIQIGLSGNTGYSTGPHLHIGKWVGGVDQDPAGSGLTLPAPCVVTQVQSDSTNGNYVALNDATGVRWVYLHMSQQTAYVGEVIGAPQEGEKIMSKVTIVGTPASTIGKDNSVHFFVRGSDDGLYHKWFNSDGWHDYEQLSSGSVMSSPSASVTEQGDFHVFATGPAGDAMHWWFDKDGWHGAESLGLPKGSI